MNRIWGKYLQQHECLLDIQIMSYLLCWDYKLNTHKKDKKLNILFLTSYPFVFIYMLLFVQHLFTVLVIS